MAIVTMIANENAPGMTITDGLLCPFIFGISEGV